MSTRKLNRAVQQLLQQVYTFARTVNKSVVHWLLRAVLLVGRQPLVARSGFVLPTTVMLLLVLTLTVGSIGYRTYTRTVQAISERQQQVIFNAATPAIDRARSKLEFLFDPQRDPRYPGGIPTEQTLLGMLYNDARTLQPGNIVVPKYQPNGYDPYTFPDETRINLGGDAAVDNAWNYRDDTDGNGQPDATVTYSILSSTPENQQGANSLRDASPAAVRSRAEKLQVRHGPLSNTNQSGTCQLASSEAAPPFEQGWFRDENNTAILRKNYQVNAFVLPDNPTGTVTTLEFHQDRQLSRGNRWGAWFRNDLEVFPGPVFNWNGAMHTEGNFMATASSGLRLYMISSPQSCLYNKEASQITVTKITTPAFEGQFVSGNTRDNALASTDVNAHVYNGSGRPPLVNPNTKFTSGNDSVKNTKKPADYALDPVKLQTEDISVGRAVSNPGTERDGAWDATEFRKSDNRMKNEQQPVPYVDDPYRADNRYGPKPRYNGVAIPRPIGNEIGNDPVLVGDEPPAGADASTVGLDGYWERRARREGLRLVVGQRIELGNPVGWGGPRGDNTVLVEPLRPWTGCAANNGTACNEARQRRTLWDNLAAVQATAVYHYKSPNGLDFPSVCLATTVHPGTATTLAKSATFENLGYVNAATWNTIKSLQGSNPNLRLIDPNAVNPIRDTIPINGLKGPTGLRNIDGVGGANNIPFLRHDFFRGRGTNGWEFKLEDKFKENIEDINSPLMVALQNLANFAGDPLGGAPTFPPPVGDRNVHPYPAMAMWGDQSVLRRVLGLMRSVGYTNLSPADKTVLHTAGCTVAMLAYNVHALEQLQLPLVTTDNTLYPSPATVPTTIYDPNNPIDVLLGYPNVAPANPSMYYLGIRGRLRMLLNPPAKTATPFQILPNGEEISNDFYDAFFGGPVQNVKTGATAPKLIEPGGPDNPEALVRLMEIWRDWMQQKGLSEGRVKNQAQIDLMNQQIQLMQLIITKEQVARDRQRGFQGSGATDVAPGGSPINHYSEPPLGHCHAWFGNLSVNGVLKIPARTSPDIEPLAMLCSTRPRYPILYSLFPATDVISPFAYAEPGTDYIPNNPAITAAYYLPGSLEDHGEVVDFSRDREDSADPYIMFGDNASITYKVVDPGEVSRYVTPLEPGSWTLPKVTASTFGGNPNTPNRNRENAVQICDRPCLESSSGTSPTAVAAGIVPTSNQFFYRIPFKDSALFNGREMMSVRVLDVDLDLLRRNSAPGGDFWLPKSGIIYAFREDAVAENEIVRPQSAGWSSCNSDTKLQSATCRMRTHDVTAEKSTDPPLNSVNLITPKPVDYFGDPDRRPYGFRLRNGLRLDRTGDEGRGMSLVSDNPIYIQGNFNCHLAMGSASPNPPANSNCTASRLEEFKGADLLPDDGSYSNFYTRRYDNTDSRFSRYELDQWRPAEILADAITIISDNFCDGSIEDGFVSAGATTLPTSTVYGSYGCTTGGHQLTSYMNQDRPATLPAANTNGARWLRSNIADSFATRTGTTYKLAEGSSPIIIDRNNNPMFVQGLSTMVSYASAYNAMNSSKPLMTALADTRVNGIIISGIVPARAGQAYGGLHNFPRFLETWSGRKFFFNGSFLQLNFSNQGTGPFDQDAFETVKTPLLGSGGNEHISYYAPPDRVWGYDVGLQIAPAGPIAQRFVTSQAIRNEFYDEPPANDPYIYNLCKVAATVAGRDPNTVCIQPS